MIEIDIKEKERELFRRFEYEKRKMDMADALNGALSGVVGSATSNKPRTSPTDQRLDRVIELLEMMVESNVGLQNILSAAAKIQEEKQ